ncbi:hypothetical protein EV702DRAFT_1051065 [Suillus placidus]|uniref:Uncharacterized protein n=1 Tax=Suillus placidus TaxID=48579 RepID=A0A9P7CVX0_9AGAM|nr:hypothetical protein EV702DRAFT_1051065 [Suillus placidus]
MFQAPKLTLRQPGCQSCVADNQQCYAYCSASACRRCANRCSLLPAPPARLRGVMRGIGNNSPSCNYCRDMKYVCQGRDGEACILCQQLCSNVAKTEEGRLIADVPDASDSESGCSDSSDDVVVCDHKPADWIDRPQGISRKRQRDDDEDDVIALDHKPADWIDRPLDARKRRRKELMQEN